MFITIDASMVPYIVYKIVSDESKSKLAAAPSGIYFFIGEERVV